VAGVPAGLWVLRVVASDGRSWEKTIVTAGEPKFEVIPE